MRTCVNIEAEGGRLPMAKGQLALRLKLITAISVALLERSGEQSQYTGPWDGIKMPLPIRTHQQGRVRHEISLYICILAQWKADYKEEVFAWHRKCENTGGRGDCASGSCRRLA